MKHVLFIDGLWYTIHCWKEKKEKTGSTILYTLSVQFSCSVVLLPDLHIGSSRGRSGGLVFPSLPEFSTVYGDPHSQRLWHSQ